VRKYSGLGIGIQTFRNEPHVQKRRVVLPLQKSGVRKYSELGFDVLTYRNEPHVQKRRRVVLPLKSLLVRNHSQDPDI
jgi:hypothetical protein